MRQMCTGSFLALQLSTCHCMPASWSRTALCSLRPVLQLQPRAHARLLATRYIKVRLITAALFAVALSSDLECQPAIACVRSCTAAPPLTLPITSSAKQP